MVWSLMTKSWNNFRTFTQIFALIDSLEESAIDAKSQSRTADFEQISHKIASCMTGTDFF